MEGFYTWRRFVSFSQFRHGDVFPPLQIVHLPLLTGKQQYLPLSALGEQIFQRRVEPLIIEGHQRIVQDQRHALVGGQHHVADGQPHGQIQLIRRTLAQQMHAAPHGVARCFGGQGEVTAQ